MVAWEEIQKTLDWIEEHLTESIGIEDLTGVSNLSEFYFQKLFTALVDKPVFEYIRLRRLAKAADELLETEKRVVDICYDAGFQNHTVFTRCFKNMYGITPNGYRNNPTPLTHFNKPDLRQKYDEEV